MQNKKEKDGKIPSRKIMIELQGDHLARFEKYKENAFIRKDAPALRKLALERLAQLEERAEGASA